jgi:hypothetical protein
MHLASILSTMGLALALPVQGAALPRGRRSAAHNKFVLVRAPQTPAASEQDSVMTTVADLTSNSTSINSTMVDVPMVNSTILDPITLLNSTVVNSTLPEGSDGEADLLPLTGTNETSPITNGTGYNTIPPQLNETDPVVSDLISSLAASSTAYASFSYSTYVPTATASTSAGVVTGVAQPASEQPVDPVDQALHAAQSYAMQQAIGSNMPTITLELVLRPTQEPDGTWDYVVHIGSDGTATAVPTFSTSTVYATGSPVQTTESQAPAAQPTPLSPYIHTPPAGPAPSVAGGSSSSAGADESVDWSGGDSGATGVAGDPTPWNPQPTPTSYYVGQGYVSAISSTGRGAVTFAYSTTAAEPVPTPAEPTAWTSGKGQQHAYPWMTSSQEANASPTVAADPSAWTSGKGQQHAYPWMTASEAQQTDSPATTAWVSGHGQQHAYPWTTQVSEPSPTAAIEQESSATTDANGVIVATLIPMPSSSTSEGSSSSTDGTLENPWLVPATQTAQASSMGSAVEQAPSTWSVSEPASSTWSAVDAPVATSASLPEGGAGSLTEVAPSATFSQTEQGSIAQPSITAIETLVPTAVESAQATSAPSVSLVPSQGGNGISFIGTDAADPSVTLSTTQSLSSSPNGTLTQSSSETSATISITGVSVQQPVSTTIQSGTDATAYVSATESAGASSAASLSPAISSTASSSLESSAAGSSAYPSVTQTWTEASISSTGSIATSAATATAVNSDSQATATSEVQSTESSKSETVSTSAETSSRSSIVIIPVTTSEPQATATSEASSSSPSSSLADATTVIETTSDSVTATASASEEGNGIATEILTVWTTQDVTATSTASFVPPTDSLTASATTVSTGSSAATSIPISSTRSQLESVGTSTSATSTTAESVASETASATITASGSATETSYTSTQSGSSSSETLSSTVSAWESTVLPTSSMSTEAVPSGTESATIAIPTTTDVPWCEEDGEEWEEVWVDEDDVQPDWEVLE